jgi:flagellar assembly protein FliH
LILKGVPLAPAARAWRAGPAPSSVALAAEAALPAKSVGQSVAVQSAMPQPLNAPRVLEWLSVQDAQVRTEIAAELADDIARVKVEAQQQGQESGQKAGREQVQRELASALKAMNAVRSECEREQQRAMGDLEQQVVEVVLAALEKLLGPAASATSGVSGAVTQILAKYAPDGYLKILVSEHDFQLLQELDAQVVQTLGAARYELCPDPRVQLGGCLIESAQGEIDGRLEVQLEELYRTIIAHKRSARAVQVES